MKIKEKLKNWGFGTRQMILSCLVLFIAVAGYININYTGVEPNEPEPVDVVPASVVTVTDDFSKFKIEREMKKSESMAVFREIIDNENSTDEAREKAQADLSAAAQAIETESMIESLLKAKGFSDTVVYIQSDTVNVIVKTDNLTPSEAAQIKDVIVESTGFGADFIKIVEKN